MTQGATEPVLATKAGYTEPLAACADHGITPAELVGPHGVPGLPTLVEALTLLTPMAKEIELCAS
ncbi:hypothetical protein GCM10010306_090780 [Streptomyces umbrinus]|uniref:hypothetical protein n=1 Tax=Streptomyces umbrinus TaxID=67370 RepID=UPI0016727950|nr:hypothetical protein [Streptomyces umbrinus]GHB82099.1 hypothetical protein GCM10010306_090780 [Streptomyces umbrinus]